MDKYAYLSCLLTLLVGSFSDINFRLTESIKHNSNCDHCRSLEELAYTSQSLVQILHWNQSAVSWLTRKCITYCLPNNKFIYLLPKYSIRVIHPSPAQLCI